MNGSDAFTDSAAMRTKSITSTRYSSSYRNFKTSDHIDAQASDSTWNWKDDEMDHEFAKSDDYSEEVLSLQLRVEFKWGLAQEWTPGPDPARQNFVH